MVALGTTRLAYQVATNGKSSLKHCANSIGPGSLVLSAPDLNRFKRAASASDAVAGGDIPRDAMSPDRVPNRVLRSLFILFRRLA